MNKKPTIKDVARLSGTSPATVSRALQHSHLVTKKTRRRIHKAIKELNYQVNTAGQALRSQKTSTILVVVPNISNPFFSKIFDGIHSCAQQQNYTVFLANTNGDEQQEEIYINQLLKRRIDGIILLNGSIPKSIQETVDLARMPIVFACEYPSKNIKHIPVVRTDNVKASEDIVNLLIENGHRKIAYVNGPKDNVLAKERYGGYKNSLKHAGININNEYFYQGNYDLASGVGAAQYFLSLENRPTAVFCANDEMAIGLMYEFQKQSILIPCDISVAGFDDIDFASKILPSLTTIKQDAYTIGYQAMQVLFLRMKAQEAPKGSFLLNIPYQMIIRDSIKNILDK